MGRYDHPRKRTKPRESCWRGCDKGWFIKKQEDGQLKAERCECLMQEIEKEKKEHKEE